MIYILDANVLIDANRDYYPLFSVPEFWEWLVYNGEDGKIKIPVEIYDELIKGKDELSSWLKVGSRKSALMFDEIVDITLVQLVVSNGYSNDLKDAEVENLGRDPFLIAYALRDCNNRCVVTTEVSKPNRQRANRKIPDVCNSLGISCFHSFVFFRELKFNTHWQDEI